MPSARHRHWFTALWSNFGQFGDQGVHYHPCIQGEPGDCDRVITGPGRDCDGTDAGHERMTLTDHGPRRRANEPVP